jgi:GT2 family glycosyltransferase/lipopolysaccharide/colanic/teichoic acid biosynthesis glycosyltransferase
MAGARRETLPDVSVIIVNYNVRDFLLQSLQSLEKALREIPSEIFVVDNASDDGSVDVLRRRFPAIQLIRNTANLGFAKANNIALKKARGKFFLLINPDTIVQEDTIRVMIDFLQDHPDVGLAGCKILNPDGSFQPACRRSFPTPWVAFAKIFGLSKLFPKTKLFGKYNLTYLDTEETYPVEAVSGSFMMLRKETYERVGGLDESFFMYGEDLDWCYRIRRAGWRIFYVHSTQIIHYKGESTRRSSLDEIRTFYNAMHLFVEKHFHSSRLFIFILRSSIGLVSFAAFITSTLRPLKAAIFDFTAVTGSLLIAEKLWRGELFRYPSYAYPIVFTVPAIIVIACLYAAGVYTQRRMSISRSVGAVFLAYVIISALTAFFKNYAFSRMMVVISGILLMIFIPGWRLVFRLMRKTSAHGRGTLFGRRTLIVGTELDAVDLLQKLRTRIGEGYEIVGFVGTTHEQTGKTLDGVQVVGSIDNVGKIIKEYRISDVIFSPKALSYAQILSVISRSREQIVNFHLVPTTMEVIVGKANVDSLDDLPLVQIAYNIDKPSHIFTKRTFDIGLSGLLLITVYPIFRLTSAMAKEKQEGFITGLPSVFNGTTSFVGTLVDDTHPSQYGGDTLFLGKPGLCGLIQLQQGRILSDDERTQYDLYYARNQSVLLDIEILIKSWLQYRSMQKSAQGK